MERFTPDAVATRIRQLLSRSLETSAAAFGDQLHISFQDYDPLRREFVFTARTEKWMQNIDGVVHGGFCAAIADHAMGIVAYCSKEADGVAPTIQLQIAYHRPLPPEEEVLVRVRLQSATARLIHLSAEVSRAQMPETICFTSNATYFCRGGNHE